MQVRRCVAVHFVVDFYCLGYLLFGSKGSFPALIGRAIGPGYGESSF
jgi:hypothetical protein